MRAPRAAAAAAALLPAVQGVLPPSGSCGKPNQNKFLFHLNDRTGCHTNDASAPFWDPVHGVFHLSYQVHPPGVPHGVHGHWISRDMVRWSQLPIILWPGIDKPSGAVTHYDVHGCFTGSATIVPGMAPDGKSPGVFQLYPGLCDYRNATACTTGSCIAAAVPADYGADPLLTNWSKPDYNPIIATAMRDPTTMWKTAHGEWRFRTYDSMEYGAASDADVKAGRFYTIGRNPTFVQAECPSMYELPRPSPGTEAEYERLRGAGELPTHVVKLSVQKPATSHGDYVQLGNYVAGAPRELGNFSAAPGWADLYPPRRFDQGVYYASKDQPLPGSPARRINWAWAKVPPNSSQTLPREVTFNPVLRQLQWFPAREVEELRAGELLHAGPLPLGPAAPHRLDIPAADATQCEVEVTFSLPRAPVRMGVEVMGATASAGQGTLIYVDWAPPSNRSAAFYEAVTASGANLTADALRLSPGEDAVTVRLYVDSTFTEAYWQQGRVATTIITPESESGGAAVWLHASANVTVAKVQVWRMSSIWVSPEAVLSAPRIA
eukprot:TRINITY_DN40084_c0_g1_i1.p1 TRINITY_DN40084_c0_g1~~TRINITY_DN40084_c0_g1_i1.p1  ORF type:complete len:574 (+),score=118.38 TRINITY_DN40084_c0_g1_i1:77-1723(+)